MHKSIWMYWHQGFENAPPVVLRCVESWKENNSDWAINLLDSKNVYEFIEPLPISETKMGSLQVAHLSDLIRTQLLIQRGGVWADPTCFCARPLNDWLFNSMQAGLFVFSNPGRDRIMANWFMAAESGNHLLKVLFSQLCSYWNTNAFLKGEAFHKIQAVSSRLLNRNPVLASLWFSFFFTKLLRVYPYMVYHYKFREVVVRDAQSKKIWSKVPKISAEGPHSLKRYGLLKLMDENMKRLIDAKSHPMFKLTWRVSHSEIQSGSVIDYLFKKDCTSI